MPLLFDINKHFDKQLSDIYWNQKNFKYPVKRLKKVLGVSDSFIRTNILTEVNYVLYNAKYLYSKNADTTCLMYADKEDIKEWILKHATFERQTQIINLEYELRNHPNVAKNAIKMLEEYKEKHKNRGLNYGTMPQPILDYINDEVSIYHAEFNYSPKERKEVAWMKVEPFDLLDNPYLYKVEGSNREKIYQEAFLRGDTKIKFGAQVTIFCKNNDIPKGFRLPYLVPLDPMKKVYVAD